MADTPEQRYERLREAVQETILRNFPNPERKGCPGDPVVREVAGRRELIEDDAWQHITHCSPCYAMFLQFKDEFRTIRRRRGLAIILSAVALVAISVGIATYTVNSRLERPVIQTDASFVAETLDLKDGSPLRGVEPQPKTPAPRTLPRKKLNLMINLPFGSEPGKYEVQLRKAGEVLITVGGIAKIRDGLTELPARIDLSKYAPGDYSVAIRQDGAGWVENPISLQ
jgi:hypothetical protein